MVRTCDTCGTPIEYRDMYCPKCNPDGLTLFEGVSKDRYDRLREALEKLITAAEQYAKNGVGENEWLLENLVDALAHARKALEEKEADDADRS